MLMRRGKISQLASDRDLVIITTSSGMGCSVKYLSDFILPLDNWIFKGRFFKCLDTFKKGCPTEGLTKKDEHSVAEFNF